MQSKKAQAIQQTRRERLKQKQEMEKQADLWPPMHVKISIIPAAGVCLPGKLMHAPRTTSACMQMIHPA